MQTISLLTTSTHLKNVLLLTKYSQKRPIQIKTKDKTKKQKLRKIVLMNIHATNNVAINVSNFFLICCILKTYHKPYKKEIQISLHQKKKINKCKFVY